MHIGNYLPNYDKLSKLIICILNKYLPKITSSLGHPHYTGRTYHHRPILEVTQQGRIVNRVEGADSLLNKREARRQKPAPPEETGKRYEQVEPQHEFLIFVLHIVIITYYANSRIFIEDYNCECSIS
jgi:hypothetical protein